MNNKKIITISLVIILVVVGGIWFYFNKNQVISYQFRGTALEIKNDSLILVGDYIKLEQDNLTAGGSKVIAVSLNSSTKVIKNIIETEGDSGFEKPVESGDQKQKIVTIADLATDLKEKNLVLTVSAANSIYNLDNFVATNVEYTTLIFK